MHLKSPPAKFYQDISTNSGRARFWAESAIEQNGTIHFVFPNNFTWNAEILSAIPSCQYTVRYFGNSKTTFLLEDDGQGGTDLTLIDEGVLAADRTEVIAGGVSVQMALKAAVDFDIDLRTHDADRHWDHGYVEN